ncbi:MAG: aminoglycoside phosphotransferase family protein [Clostridia bacterium]|nr:aminoglycoside phosphotransferase family protein [Clostridia bacterium]
MDIPTIAVFSYFVLGYLAFFGSRLALRAYKQIFRYGSRYAFLREALADGVGIIAFSIAGTFFGTFSDDYTVSVVLLVGFSVAYALISLLIRVIYHLMFRITAGKTAFAKLIKKILEVLAFVDFSSKEPGAILRLALQPDVQSTHPINQIQNIIDKFAIRGDVKKITQIKKGYINQTYKIETLSDTGHVHRYTLQRINTNVFPDVDALMNNFKITTDHLHGRLTLPGGRKMGSVATIRSTKDGCAFLKDDSGCWRMLTYFDEAYSLDIPDKPETFYYAGVAFGSFLKEMQDVDINDIKEVIPNFHNTKSRYLDLEKSIEANPKDRVKDVTKEIQFIRDRADKFSLISDALASGKIPTRICHNDCNLNNVLFDNETHLPIAVIDLDTVMPSSPLYDYGDSMRIGTNTAKDDEKDLSKVSCDLGLYEQYARGYLEACGDVLTKEELELLPYASLIITMEDGIRFLMDHIDGDTYYNIYYPGQNLDRSRTQLKLVEDMEKKLPQIKQILRKIYAEFGLEANIE